MTDTRRAIQSGQGNAIRRLRGDKCFTMARMADLTGHTGVTCQFIAGEDHYMCGKPGYPYCAEHRALCYRPRDIQESGEDA